MQLLINNLRQFIHSSKLMFLFIILGFTVAFTAFLVIAIQVKYDFSYNKNFEKSDEIYRFNRYHHANGNSYWTINQDLAKEMEAKIPEIKSYALLQEGKQVDVSLPAASAKKEYPSLLMEATPGFLEVFTPEILSGNTQKIFDEKGKALISEKTAGRIFGDANPIGQALQIGENTLSVMAVYKDFPKNCSLTNGIYTYMEPNSSNNWNYYCYFLIDPQNAPNVAHKINSADILGEETVQHYNSHPEERVEFQLPALEDLYLHGYNKRIHTTLGLLAVGVILLAIAFINYINFSISMAPGRIKNINIHKIFGIERSRLRLAILSEGVAFTALALVLSLVCLHFFKSTSLASNFVADLSIAGNGQMIAATVAGIVLLSFLTGIYPALYITSFGEAFAMKGSFTLSPKGVVLRNSLIVFQFAASIALICIASMITLQNYYVKNYSWGFQKENIAYLSLLNTQVDDELLGDELKQNGAIIDYTSSWNLPGRIGMSWSRELEGKYIDYFTVWPVTPNFLDFFGVKVVAGNDFPKERDREKIIFNEEFMKVNGFTEDIIGKEFEGFSPGDIVGVVENIHFESLHESIKPMAFVVFPNKEYYNYVYLKLSGDHLPATIAQIEKTWKKFTDKPFDLTFLDVSMDALYKNETNTGNLISVVALISVLIAMMGVYGLVLLNTRYKTKEIAIRKINGATEEEILQLLNRNMLWMLAVSFVIAVPAAYAVIQNWLGNFAYKAAVPWWLFIGSGVIVLLISAITVSWQSWRAATANPVDSLKIE